MTEELEQLLKNLKLRRMLSVYDEQLRAAEKAESEAAKEETAMRAKETFWERLKHHLFLD